MRLDDLQVRIADVVRSRVSRFSNPKIMVTRMGFTPLG